LLHVHIPSTFRGNADFDLSQAFRIYTISAIIMSRRGAVKVNPVTGKMEKVEPPADGVKMHRDGCMMLPDTYINAAKELGLGSDEGVCY
jgi:hypothetical protein